MLPAALIAAAIPVLGCDDRITAAFQQAAGGPRRVERFAIDRRRDRIFGPLAFSDLRSLARRSEWNRMVERDQWIKTIAIVRPGSRVTIEVPPAQRAWMRLTYGGADPYGVTLRACRRGEGESGPSGNTAFSGGFVIDYASAPRQGRCARVVVRVAGRSRPLRGRLIARRVPGCP